MKGIKNIIFSSDKEKLTDKAFRQSIVISIFCIVLCMIALCSVTWAWFSKEVSSSSSTIITGNCTVAVSVMNLEAVIAPKTDTSDTYTLEADKSYQIIITSTGSAQSSYCKFVINGQEYYTEQISTKNTDNTISFTLAFDKQTDVEIITCWGTSSKPEKERAFKNGEYYHNLKESEPITTTTDANSSAEASTETETDAPTPETRQ